MLLDAAEYLPYDDVSRSEALVAIAFVSRAALSPALAEALTPAFDGFAGTLDTMLRAAFPHVAPGEGRRLAALLDGLRLPVLIGALSHADALAVVERHLTETGRRDRDPGGP